MKTVKRSIASLLVLSLLIGLFTVMPMTSASAEVATGTTYYLYDYVEKLMNELDNGTELVNDTPWSLQYKKNGGEWKDSLNTSSRSVDGVDWIYRFDNSNTFGYGTDAVWGGYAPGFAFYYPQNNTADRYQWTLAIPTNSATDNEDIAWRYDVAYSFIAPQDGYYNIGKADQNKVLSFDDCNYFSQYNVDEKLDFGVRITVDGTTVWPADDYEYYQDGWAVFGTKDAATTRIEVPSINNVRLTAGAVLRVELTTLTGANAPYTQRIKGGMFSVTYSKPLPTEAELPETLPVKYEIYDYYNDFIAGNTSTSPWSLEMHTSDGWVMPNAYNPEGEYTYVYNTAYGSYYPGFAFYNRTDIERNMASVATPINDASYEDGSHQWNTAYTFTAPFTGNYTLGRADRDKVAAFDITDYFLPMDGGATGLEFGVRITVNDETIWPAENDPNYYNGYARFGKGIEGVAEKIEVPTISDLFLAKESVVRVEFTAFTQTLVHYYCRIYGMVGMQLDTLDGTAVADIREWENAGLYCDAITSEVKTEFTAYDGDVLYNKDDTTNANEAISLTVKTPSGFGTGVDISINGYVLHLQGADSSIGGTAINIPVSDDNSYSVTYKVATTFAANEITGALILAVINGTEYNITTAVAPVATKEGIVITNNSGLNDIVFTAGELSLNSGAEIEYYSDYKVLYVNTTDIEAIKSQIVSGDLYTVMSVGTGYEITRLGNTYTIALKNDVNSDCNVDVRDIVRLKRYFGDAVTLTTAEKFAVTGYAFDPETSDLVVLRQSLLNG